MTNEFRYFPKSNLLESINYVLVYTNQGHNSKIFNTQ